MVSLVGILSGSLAKESACNAGDPDSIHEWGRSPGKGNGNPLQYSGRENSMDGGAWWAAVYGVTQSWTRLNRLSSSSSSISFDYHSTLPNKENRGTKELSDFPKITQLVRGNTELSDIKF